MRWPGVWSYDAEMIQQNAASEAGKGAGVGHALTGGRGDRERSAPLAPFAEAGVAGAVFDKNAAIDQLGHPRQVADVHRMHDGRVPATAFGCYRQIDRLVRVAHTNDG